MNKKNYISVIIPCYKSENTIESVTFGIVDEMKKRKCNYEIVLVNDGSPDMTWEKIKSLSRENNNIIGVNFTKNFGQHAATMAGLRESKGDIAITMDDDGQTDPQYIWSLIDKLEEGYDVVLAEYPSNKESLFRRIGSGINRLMAEMLIGKPKEIKGSSYRAIRRYIVDEMINYDKSYPYIAGLIYRSTKNVGQVEVEHMERISGKSGYSLSKLLKLIMNGFTSFSVVPLRIASYCGMLFSVIGFIYGVIIAIKKLINPNVLLGYSSLMATLLFIGGMLMFMIGIVGEYVGRIYISINNAPQYVVKERTITENK